MSDKIFEVYQSEGRNHTLTPFYTQRWRQRQPAALAGQLDNIEAHVDDQMHFIPTTCFLSFLILPSLSV